jgi:hypothetical protein
MAPVFAFRPKQPVVWHHRLPSRSNRCCLYCGRAVNDGSIPSDEEHLIGRRFVPDNGFATGQEFNFLFRACKDCNGEKAELERHVSSVTLFTSAARKTDPAIDQLARNKAEKDFHPIGKKPVRNSSARFEIEGAFGPASFRFGIEGPPQLVPDYVKALAFRHVQGLFSLVTSKEPRTVGGTRLLSAEHFRFMGYYGHGDWGNPQLVEVSRRVRAWPIPAVIHTAGGFFRAVMRRQEGERGEWFWALEWNRSIRVVGGITDRAQPAVFDDLPAPDWKRWDATTRFRSDCRLRDEDDILFPWPEESLSA